MLPGGVCERRLSGRAQRRGREAPGLPLRTPYPAGRVGGGRRGGRQAAPSPSTSFSCLEGVSAAGMRPWLRAHRDLVARST